MVCYRPVPAMYSSALGHPLRARIIPWTYNDAGERQQSYYVCDHTYVSTKDFVRQITIPCGWCFGCRLDNARMWSTRIMHEEQTTDLRSWFVTLTYSDDRMPAHGNLCYDDLTKFFKRARPSRHGLNHGNFRYFACGEYGDKTLRPHFHFCGFGFEFEDLQPFKKVNGNQYYISRQLLDTWQGRGHVIVGALEWDSAQYVSRYVTKKMKGRVLREWIDPETGECVSYDVEQARMSKGLGVDYYRRYQSEIWANDSVLFGKGKFPVKPPRYYFKLLQRDNPDLAASIKFNRYVAQGVPEPIDYARDRELKYAMEVKRLQMKTLLRSL